MAGAGNPPKLDRALVWDYSTGEVIDPLTGEVVDTIFFEPILYRDNDEKERTPHFSPVTPSDEMHPYHLSKINYEKLLQAISLYQEVQPLVKSRCPVYIVDLTVRKYLKILGKKKIRTTREILAAIVYIALSENGETINIFDYARACQVDPWKLKTEVITLMKMLGKTRLLGKTLHERVEDYIRRLSATLNLPPEVTARAIELCGKTEHLPGRTPKYLAGAFLYIAMREAKFDPTPLRTALQLSKVKEIVRVLGYDHR